MAIGYKRTVEELLDPDGHGVPPMDTGPLFRTFPYLERGIGGYPSQTRLIFYMVNNPRPLEEEMALSGIWYLPPGPPR